MPTLGLALNEYKRIAMNIAKAIFPSFVDNGSTKPKINELL
jgi:hypothetical protein